MEFNIPIEFQTWLLFILAISAILLTFLYFLAPMRCIAALKNTIELDDESTALEETENAKLNRPKVSIVVHSLFPQQELPLFLEHAMSQNYPDYEVIVVCETDHDSADALGEIYSAIYPNLYITFLPPGSHNLSRRKLALTLGMKAAKGDYVVTTISNAIIPSADWLSNIIQPFKTDGVDIVLGYSHMKYSNLKGIGRWYKEFQTILTDASWIGYALCNNPYRGDGYNLAFRRELFFENKGYSKSQYLHSGEDDLFINEVSTDSNTQVVLSPESILTIDWEGASNNVWNANKEQHAFTSRWLPQSPFRRAGWASAMQWIIIIMLAACSLLALPNVVPSIASAVLLLSFWTLEIILYRQVAARLEATRLWWSLPIFWLLNPISNALFKIRQYGRRNRNYTWQR